MKEQTLDNISKVLSPIACLCALILSCILGELGWAVASMLFLVKTAEYWSPNL